MPHEEQFPDRNSFLRALRDWFAGQALIATYMNGFAGPHPKDRAVVAYKMADAMLKQRGE
jgi:hypothetical protein